MPSFPSLEPMISHSYDVDFFKDFKNEFTAITYNDDLTSKLTEPSCCYKVRIFLVIKIWMQGLSSHGMGRFKNRSSDESRRHAEGRKSGARLSRGHFIGCLTIHFGLVSDQGLRGLSVVTRELLMIDLHELSRLNICERIGDACGWVASGPKRQPDVTANAPEAAEDAPAVDKRIARLEEDVHELRRSIVRLCRDVDRSITDQGRFTTWMVSCMTQLMDASGRTYQAFNSTLVEIGLDVADTLCFQLGEARHMMTWMLFILALGLHTAEEMAEDGFQAYWLGSERVIPDKGILGITGWQAPKKVNGVDLFYLRDMD
nr:hypothetical protein [Tanacetum cinerariifolium]